MTGLPSTERATAAPEGPRLPLVCGTCGTVYQPGEKVETESCGAPINFLSCDVAGYHLVAYTLISGWTSGMSCPQRSYGCTGTLQDSGVTRPCPGRLAPQV